MPIFSLVKDQVISLKAGLREATTLPPPTNWVLARKHTYQIKLKQKGAFADP